MKDKMIKKNIEYQYNMQANEISLPVKPNILKKSVAPHPRISLSFIPACERKKEIFKKTDCLPKNRFRHPAEF